MTIKKQEILSINLSLLRSSVLHRRKVFLGESQIWPSPPSTKRSNIKMEFIMYNCTRIYFRLTGTSWFESFVELRMLNIYYLYTCSTYIFPIKFFHGIQCTISIFKMYKSIILYLLNSFNFAMLFKLLL